MEKDDIINLIEEIAAKEGIATYLVGGCVRDEILGIGNKDIDITVEGNAKKFAESLSKRLGVKIKKSSQFGTFNLFVSSFRVDIATARRETYPGPGKLPSVEHGSIVEDLSRRDFTINSMAIPVGTKTLIDPFQGLNDIKKRLIRVLHGKSFVEDSTRIFRALRFAERLDFKIEQITASLMEEAIEQKTLLTISPARIRNELSLCFKETKKWNILERIAQLGILEQMGMVYPERGFLEEVEKFATRLKVKKEPLYFMALTDGGRNRKILTGRERRYLSAVETLLEKITLLKKTRRKGEIYTILRGFPPHPLAYIGVKEGVTDKISTYLEEIEPLKLEITGEDIKSLGVSEGRVIGEILLKVKREKLDGKLLTREEELEYAKSIVKSN
jgi:hypothetical protein